MADVTVLILTYNEQLHIERCIRSVKPFAREIVLIDSGSTDATRAIAEREGCRVVEHAFTNHAEQFNWGLDNVAITTEWVMRIDADEYVLPELADEIERRLPTLPADVSGINLKRRVIFMGRWIRYGGYYPIVLLRLFRRGQARSEQRVMDEHIRVTTGRTVTFDHDFVDENLNDLTWWTAKHNNYATREALELMRLATARASGEDDGRFMVTTRQAERKRWLKEHVYARLPVGLRPLFYFIYRYFILLGFLDGYQGVIWHTLQGFWYRFLVDAKLIELTRRSQGSQSESR